jgi:outer membrane protein assembly factor BamB
MIIFLLVAIVPSALAQKPDTSLVTLTECWQYRSPSLPGSQAALDGSNLYIAEAGGRISAISLSNGVRLWSTELGGDVISNVVTDGANVYIVNSASGKVRLHSLSVTSGIQNADADLPITEAARLLLAGGRILTLEDSGYLASFRSSLVKAEWRSFLSGVMLSAAALTTDKLLVATSDNKLHAIAVADGKETGTYPADAAITAVDIAEGDLVIGDIRGNVIRYDEGVRSWRFRNGARINVLTSTPKGLITASADNFVYLINNDNGDIKWKKRMSARVAGVLIDGDVIVVTAVGEPSAAILDLDNGKNIGQLSISDDESFIGMPLSARGQLIFFTSSRILAASRPGCSAK